jgi:hypothetical protein
VSAGRRCVSVARLGKGGSSSRERERPELGDFVTWEKWAKVEYRERVRENPGGARVGKSSEG